MVPDAFQSVFLQKIIESLRALSREAMDNLAVRWRSFVDKQHQSALGNAMMSVFLYAVLALALFAFFYTAFNASTLPPLYNAATVTGSVKLDGAASPIPVSLYGALVGSTQTSYNVTVSPSALPVTATVSGGGIFVLIVLLVSGDFIGRLCTLVKLPALFGCLLIGLIYKIAVPTVMAGLPPAVLKCFKDAAFSIILFRAGINFDEVVVRREFPQISKNFLIPLLLEVVFSSLAAYGLLPNFGVPWCIFAGALASHQCFRCCRFACGTAK